MPTARLLLPALLCLVAVLPAALAAPPVVPKEEGLYLQLAGDRILELPRLAGKPCDAATAGLPRETSKDGREKFLYLPAGVLDQIPVVAAKDIQGGSFVTRDEKLEGLRNLVFLEPYLAGAKILAGGHKDGCAEGEIADRHGFIAFSAWGWSFDRVLRATYVDEVTTRLEVVSRVPFAAGRTRPIAGPESERIAAFGIFISTDTHRYPFLPDTKLVGFLADFVARPSPGGVPAGVLALAGKLETHLEKLGAAADPEAKAVVAAVYRQAGRAEP